jgi:hypothetical protein
MTDQLAAVLRKPNASHGLAEMPQTREPRRGRACSLGGGEQLGGVLVIRFEGKNLFQPLDRRLPAVCAKRLDRRGMQTGQLGRTPSHRRAPSLQALERLPHRGRALAAVGQLLCECTEQDGLERDRQVRATDRGGGGGS